MTNETREERLYYYREWEADFAGSACRSVYPYPACDGRWGDGPGRTRRDGKGEDFVCTRCGRFADAKYSGEIIASYRVRFNCSQIPWDRYLPNVILAIRTAWDSTPEDVAILKGHGRIVESHPPSSNGTKEFGDIAYYVIEATCTPIISERMMQLLRHEAKS